MRRVGIIGFGGFGRFLAKAWAGLDGVTLTAVADINPNVHAEGLARYTDWLSLLDSGLVDTVSVATPPATHAEIAIEAVNRGIHVLVEKPIAVSREDGIRLVEAERQSDAVATVDFMLRYNPIITCMHDWCRTGQFGPLQRVTVENYAQDEALAPSHWFWDPDVSGGILIEHAVHFIDIVNGCSQAPVSHVHGQAWRRASGETDRMTIEVCYEDGLVSAQYHAFNRLEPFERTALRFVFAGAQVDIDGWIPMKGRVLALAGQGTEVALEHLPGLSIEHEQSLGSHRSMPLAHGEGQDEIDRLIDASFEIGGTKEDAYLDALRMLMSDFLQAGGEDPMPMRVTLADGLKSVEIAEMATDAAERSLNTRH